MAQVCVRDILIARLAIIKTRSENGRAAMANKSMSPIADSKYTYPFCSLEVRKLPPDFTDHHHRPPRLVADQRCPRTQKESSSSAMTR